MRRTFALLTVTGLLALPAAHSSGAAVARTTIATSPRAGAVATTARQPERRSPLLATDAAGHESLLTMSAPRAGTGQAAYLARKAPGGAWGTLVRVTPFTAHLRTTLAMSPNGWTAVAWGTWDNCSSSAYVRLRTPRGRWLPAHRLSGQCAPVATAVNSHGDVAVLAYGPDAARSAEWSVATRIAGRWHRSGQVNDYGSQQPLMGMDRAGRVAVTYSSASDREGTGYAVLRSLAPSGRWERVRHVPMGTDRVERSALAVAPGGAITVAGCRVSAAWDSSWEGPRCTDIEVFGLASWDAAFVPELSVPDAELGQMATDPRGTHVAFTYLRWSAPDQYDDPTESAFTVRDLSWAAPVQLDQRASTYRTAYLASSLAPGADGTVVVAWTRYIPASGDAEPIHVSRATGTGLAEDAVIAHTGTPGSGSPQPSALANGDVAWQVGTTSYAGHLG